MEARDADMEARGADDMEARGADDMEARDAVEPGRSFDDSHLCHEVLEALQDLGYEIPTPVQATLIPLMNSNLDLIVQARTGTGKTAAFGIPLVERFSGDDEGLRAIVIAPTRELALQVAAEIDALGRYKGVRTATVYGGVSLQPQVKAIRRGQVVVGTPGRLLDHLRRGTLSLDRIEICILDEADEMLSMGFLEEVEAILRYLPKRRQFILTSATMPQDIRTLSQRYMTAPEFVSLSSDRVAAEQVAHDYYLVMRSSRLKHLLAVIREVAPDNAIVFCNTRADSALVASRLRHHGLDAEVINGDLPQREREKIMNRCKQGRLRFLVATDVAARGNDISGLSHVINFQLPEQIHLYIHRTGRTGRAGRQGRAISLISPQELGTFYYLRKTFGLEMSFKELPELSAVEDPLAGVLERELDRDARLGAIKPSRALPEMHADRRPRQGQSPAHGAPSRGDSERGRHGSARNAARREPRRSPRPVGRGPTPTPTPTPKQTGETAPLAPLPSARNEEQPECAPNDRSGHKSRSHAASDQPSQKGARSSCTDSTHRSGRRRTRRSIQPGHVRIHMNAGRETFERGKMELRELLHDVAGLSEEAIGRIDLHRGFSFVNVLDEQVQQLFEKMNGYEVKGVLLQVELARMPMEKKP